MNNYLERITDAVEKTDRIVKEDRPFTFTATPEVNHISNDNGTWVCKKCGDTNDANATACKGCGAYK